MNALKLQEFEVETEFINELARHRPMDLKVSVDLGNGGPDIADVVHVLRSGRVKSSDMLEQTGLWVIVGETTDEDLIELEVAVASEECEVEILGVAALERSRK